MPPRMKFIIALLISGILGSSLGAIGGTLLPLKIKQESTTIKDSTPSTPLKVNGAGEIFETTVTTEGIGKILVRVELPQTPRYTEGAPVLVNIPNFYTPEDTGFSTLADFTKAGGISIALISPGRSDGNGSSSEGIDDYGGEDATKALRDVLLFATGEKNNSDGYSLAELSAITPLSSDVGIYAFSHQGIAATKVLGTYAEDLAKVAFFVGRENPTLDLMSTLELGHWEVEGKSKTPVINSLYQYPQDYSSNDISIDYSSIDYDAASGSPYFDTNQNGKLNSGEFSLGTQNPNMFGKRYYSSDLLHALKDKGIFTDKTWPSDLVTPEEADANWPTREANTYYPKIGALESSLHVMLVFALEDHVQTVSDKPHIHQAYDGFTAAGIWVRLNPDLSYIKGVNAQAAAKYTEHNAQTEPSNWASVSSWAYSNSNAGPMPLASVLEMADRTHFKNWSVDLENILSPINP